MPQQAYKTEEPAAFYRDEIVEKREQLLIQDRSDQKLTKLHQQHEMWRGTDR